MRKRIEMFLLFFAAIILSGCYRLPPELRDGYSNDGSDYASGGGQDAVTADMPFASGYRSKCTQCAGGSYSHQGPSTLYDIDLDTPNNVDDIVYAPVAGIAHVHTEYPDSGFGIHVNIDLEDGTYIVLGHLSEVFIQDVTPVVPGSMIGFEGSTGDSSGDHIHMGRHQGSASQDAAFGDSVEGLSVFAYDTSSGETRARPTGDMVCGLTSGHDYVSQLATSLWHPNGSLVKTPDVSTVYLLEDGTLRPFLSEGDFWDRNFDFADVLLISDEEMGCYTDGSVMTADYSVDAVWDGVDVWLLVNNNGSKTASRVPASYWTDVLMSWGIDASDVEELLAADEFEGFDSFDVSAETAVFRDGSLIRQESDPATYFISDGIAMPFDDEETYLLMGLADFQPQWVPEGAVESVQGQVGSCSVNAYCISREDITSCGGPEFDEGVFPGSGTNDDQSTASTGGTTTPGTTTPGTTTSPGTGTATGSGCDADSDGFDDVSCGGTDCDDGNANVFPGAQEVCDYADNNCDGVEDEGVQIVYYEDSDDDGYGVIGTDRSACSLPYGYAELVEDCDDSDEFVNPASVDVWDVRDNDCDGDVDEHGLISYNRYHFAHNFDDWQHMFALLSPAVGWLADGHWVTLYPSNVCSDLVYQPYDTCNVVGGGETVELHDGYELVAIAQCSGTLSGYELTLVLEETSAEFTDYENDPLFSCARLGYGYADSATWSLSPTAVQFYRHRSAPMTAGGLPRTGVADNMWSIIPCEYDNACDPLIDLNYDYDEHEPSWWAPGGGY